MGYETVTIVGAGSIGLLFGAKFALAGIPVRMITHSREQAEAINRTGVRLLGPAGKSGSEAANSIKATAFADFAEDEPVKGGWMLLAVKQSHLGDKLLAVLGRHTQHAAGLVAFQNGIGHEQKLRTAVPAHKLFMAVTTEGALRVSMSEVRHTGQGWTKVGPAISPLAPDADSPIGNPTDPDHDPMKRVETIAGMLDQAGFRTEIVARMDGAIWDKLLINAVINPVTALLGVKNGDLLRSREVMQTMQALLGEGMELAHRLGIPISDSLWEQILKVCEATRDNRSSMLQDLEQGRLTEIDWINGGLLKAADRVGMDLKVHRAIYGLVKGLEGRLPESNHGERGT